MIELRQVSLRRGNKQLLSAADLSIHPGEKVGLIGSNGSGKSSLLSLLRGTLKEDSGDVLLSKNWRISSVSQELEQSDTTAMDFVLSGDEHWFRTQQELTVAESENNTTRIVELHDVLASIDGYSTPARAGELLHGLGFSKDQQLAPTKSFSGGWQMRLNLARALMKPCELMLLDEPTNHLDLDAIVWLERWLQYFPGTLIVISHDSIFLDKVVDKIAWLDQKKFATHKGNYTDFLKWRAEKIQLQQKTFLKQEQKRHHLQSFVDRFRATASKAKQAQSRLKMLDKMEIIASVQANSGFQFSLPAAEHCPNPVVQFKNGFLGYANKAVLKKIDLNLGPKDRIGLLGANGAGKSTLIKTLSGQMDLLSGEVTQSSKLKIGYFAQHQVDLLNLEETPFWHLEKAAPGTPAQALRSFLGNFGFASDMAFTRVGVLSGGEKARLVLCLLSWQKPHLLLLDEPTNHLDLEMREALALALQAFNGAVVLVSHDRQLLGSVVDQFWLVANGTIVPFDDDLDAYAEWLMKERKKEDKKISHTSPVVSAALSTDMSDHGTNQGSEQGSDHTSEQGSDHGTNQGSNQSLHSALPHTPDRAPPLDAPPAPILTKENRIKLSKLEKKIDDLQKQGADLDLKFSEPELYQPHNADRLEELTRQKALQSTTLEQTERQWYVLLAGE